MASRKVNCEGVVSQVNKSHLNTPSSLQLRSPIFSDVVCKTYRTLWTIVAAANMKTWEVTNHEEWGRTATHYSTVPYGYCPLVRTFTPYYFPLNLSALTTMFSSSLFVGRRMSYLCSIYFFTHIGVKCIMSIWETWQMSQKRQDLFTLFEHMGSVWFWWGSVLFIF